MNPVRCLLVDDEELAIDILEMYLGKLEGFEVAGRCTDAEEATKFLLNHPVDLLFLDIQMPKLNGMEWIKNLPNPPGVIFCTAFDRFALESYEVNAIDYLLKPVSFERFEKAARKAAQAIFYIQQEKPDPVREEFILVRADRKLFKVNINEILYIHSLSNYYKIVTSGKNVVAYGSLSSLENELPTSRFIRIHRSYLVAIDKIEAISSNSLILNGQALPIGRNYRSSVEAVFNK
jgi:DNA-binding LytR/AlgR family response regulator